MSNQDWKRKYLDVVEKLEAHEKQWQLSGSLLRQAMSRVALAAQGQDSQLDQELASLRKLIASRSPDPDQLETIVDALSVSISRLDGLRTQESEVLRPQDLLSQWMDSLSLPSHLTDPLKQLRNSIQQTTNINALEAPLDELAQLLNACLQAPADSAQGGIMKNLFGWLKPKNNAANNDQASDNDIHQLRHFSILLLDKLALPREFHAEVEKLKTLFSESASESEIARGVNAIADIITAMQQHMEDENRELQDFLRQLTENLREIDHNIAGAQSHHRASRDSSRKLDEAVHSQVQQIESSVDKEQDPEQLKAKIQQRVNAIREHLEQFRQNDEKNQQQIEAQLEQLNSRIHNMESEGDQLRQRLKEKHELAMHDPLTGLPNRLAYEERLVQEYTRWKRYGKSLVLMVIDIDTFKNINDTYGHTAGDKALKLIAEQMQKNLRSSDFLARYGGEEFVVLMPETDINSALIAANKLREEVAKCNFHYEGANVRITVSAGLSELREGDSGESVFQRADQAMLNAKQAGRNRCETDQG